MSITPAPWGAFYDKRRDAWNVASTHGCGIVCEVGGTDGEAQENAALIAAAPHLLRACTALLSIVEAEYEDDPEKEDLGSWKRAIEQARKAIDKAIGKE